MNHSSRSADPARVSFSMLCKLSFLAFVKSEHVRLVQYRARKQAADLQISRLLTRAVLYQRPNIVNSAFNAMVYKKENKHAEIDRFQSRVAGRLLCR